MTGRRIRGFTLLEALVAITVFSLVITVLYAGYRLGIRSWESGERKHAAISELRLAGAFVRRHATQAFPLTVSKNNAWRLWFRGEARRLVLVTPMPAHLGQGGMYEMTLAIDEHEDGSVLTVSRRLLHPDAEQGRPGVDEHPRALARGLSEARFDYFGPIGDDREASWSTRWVDRQRLPRLVRLRLASKLAGDWPDIVVHVSTDAIRFQRTVAPGDPGQSGAAGVPTTGQPSLLAPGLTR